MATATPARCATHVDRAAYARCMSCQSMLCQECATQWEGIWHCAACLAQKRGTAAARTPVLSWIGVLAFSLTFLYLGARVMVWASALVASWF